MRKLILYFSLAFVMSGCGTLARYKEIKPVIVEGKIKAIEIEKPQPIFKLKEKLTYTIYWLKIPVGTVTGEVKEITSLNGREVYHIEGKIKSNKLIRPLFWADDRVETFIDKENLYPLRFIRDRNESRYRSSAILNYDQANHRMDFFSITDGTQKRVPIPDKVQDPLSVFYYFRTLSLDINSSPQIFVNQDEKNWEVTFQIESAGLMNLPGVGVFDAFMVEPVPKLNGRVFDKGRGWIWFSADEKRIPLMVKIQTRIPLVGTVVAVLETIE